MSDPEDQGWEWQRREVEAIDAYDASIQAQELARHAGGTVDRVTEIPTAVVPSSGQQVFRRWSIRLRVPTPKDPDADS